MTLFKIPKFVRKRNLDWEASLKNVATFHYTKITNPVDIGRGSFAAVFAATHTVGSISKQVVVKKLFDLDDHEKNLFVKEVKLLQALSHPNIVKFHGMCMSPPSIMMEYMFFDFGILDRDQKVHSLKELLIELSDADTEDFAHVMPVIACDVTRGLSYLHDQGVVHRDLKPANVLVSNHHYRDLSDARLMEKSWSTQPVICKLTDFGEARSKLINTRNFNLTSTKDVSRGTPAYMAPELLLCGDEQCMSLFQLKKVDIWALGLLLFCVVNPGMSTPYSYEFKKRGVQPENYLSYMKIMIRDNRLPSSVPEFAPYQNTGWKQVYDAFQSCASFDTEKRPAAREVLQILTNGREISEGKKGDDSLKVCLVGFVCTPQHLQSVFDVYLIVFQEREGSQIRSAVKLAI